MKYNFAKKPKHKSAQILLFTLIVITILTIATISVIILSTRDVRQLVTGEKYDQAYNAAETKLTELLDRYGKGTIDPLPAECSGSTSPLDIACLYPAVLFNNNTAYRTSVNIKNKKEIEGIKIDKDRSIEVLLSGYTGGVTITWATDVTALDFSIIFENPSTPGVYKTVKDVYDVTSPVRLYEGVNPASTFAYQTVPGGVTLALGTTRSNTIASSLNSTLGLTANDAPLYLQITPRTTLSNTTLTIVPTNGAGYPYQSREFYATSIDTNDTNSPVANVRAVILLNSQTNGIFGYSLLTEGVVEAKLYSTP